MTESLEFLYKIKPTRPEMLTEGPTRQEAERVAQHFEYLKALLRDSKLIMAGRTQNTDKGSFGVVIFRADSELEARKIMESDPAVKNGVMCAKLFPYKVALMEFRDR